MEELHRRRTTQTSPPESFSIAILPVLSSAGVDPRDASSNSGFYLNMAAHAAGDFSLRIVALPSGCRDALPTTATSIIRRLLNYGDSFFEADSAEWAQRAGILQLSPWTLNSLQRVNRLIETSMLNREIKAERLADICPICESRHIVTAQQEEFSRECRQCNTLWGRTDVNGAHALFLGSGCDASPGTKALVSYRTLAGLKNLS
jgi:hypothetical protein